MIASLVVALAAPAAHAGAWSRVAGIDGAPVEALAGFVAADGAARAAAAGLAGVYLTTDGGGSWKRHRGVDPLAVGCGPMDLATDAQGVVFRCRRGPEAAASCWRLGWDAAGSQECATSERDRSPLPEAPGSTSPRPLRLGSVWLRAASVGRGAQRSTDAGATWAPSVQGMDGVAVVRLDLDPSGGVRADLAVPLTVLAIHEGSPWAQAGQAACTSTPRDAADAGPGVSCALLPAPIGQTPAPARHDPAPDGVARALGDVARPLLAIWPHGPPAQARWVGSDRGLWVR